MPVLSINNISLLHAGDTETLEIFWNQTEKSGVYGVNVSLFMRSVLIDNKKTQFEVTLQGDFFDTDTPLNPYPSIMGNHTGTITPNADITVSKLYTYSCAGTGRHTESTKLYENGDLIANGTWNGYKGDWHNLSLHNLTGGTPYVTLSKNHEYNYTLITGSYPQMHHNRTLLTANGWINITEFTDANGRKHTNWIPAIRLH